MPIQETITGNSQLIGNKTKIVYSNGVTREEFHSRIIGVADSYKDSEQPCIKLKNKYGKPDSHYRDVEPVKCDEDEVIYPVKQETFEKFKDVEEITTGFNK